MRVSLCHATNSTTNRFRLQKQLHSQRKTDSGNNSPITFTVEQTEAGGVTHGLVAGAYWDTMVTKTNTALGEVPRVGCGGVKQEHASGTQCYFPG